MTSPTFLLSLAPSDLMLGEMSRMRDESDFSIVSGSQQPNARGGDLGAYNWLNKLLRTFSNNPFFLGHFPTFNLGHFPASWFCLGHFPTIYFFLGHFPTKHFGHFPTSHFFCDKFQQRPFRPFSKSRISI